MNFNNIKAGDTVLLPIDIYYCLGRCKTFHIAKKVDRVTKTQIIIGQLKFRKESGSEIGERKYRSIKQIGQPKSEFSFKPGETYQDETKEAKAFKHSVELRFKLRTDLEELSKKIRDIELNSENLMNICNAVNKLKELIGE